MSQHRQFYSELEKSLIDELVGKHKDVLESKKNDYKSIRQKNIAWEALSHEFNSQSGVTKRDSKQLKKCWGNVKARAKKQIAKQKRDAKFTLHTILHVSPSASKRHKQHGNNIIT